MKLLSRLLPILSVLALTTACTQNITDEERSAQELYELGHAAMEDKLYQSALTKFKVLKTNFPYVQWTQKAALEMAEAHAKSGDPLTGILELDEFQQLYPTSPDMDKSYWLEGQFREQQAESMWDGIFKDPADRDAGFFLKAYQSYRLLIQRYPKSDYAPQAQDRITVLYNTLARHELRVAEFYSKRHAYVASVGRIKRLLSTYPKSDSIAAALTILIDNYDQLNMPQAKADTEKALQNYQQKQNQSATATTHS